LLFLLNLHLIYFSLVLLILKPLDFRGYFKILFDKYHLGYFRKVGMRYFHQLRNKFYCPVVNADKLWSLLLEEVLGKGELPPHPLVVKTKLVSKRAEKKIKEANSVVVLIA
ncbi:60S ribosomal protein L27a-2-like, partial [Amborella trichopoda]|uniref:60S ribosomal protein L27a-2-like n=1 Tax=Amborella trichopoda TaxID=13333 RepID=UPI0009C16701